MCVGNLASVFFLAFYGWEFRVSRAKGLEAEFPEKIKTINGIKLNEAAISALC